MLQSPRRHLDGNLENSSLPSLGVQIGLGLPASQLCRYLYSRALEGGASPEWPSSTTVVIAIALFASEVWRGWSGWEETRRRNVARRSLGAHLLRALGAYCICVAAPVAVGLLMGANPALLSDPVLWGVAIAFLAVSLLASWLDWRKAVLVERDSRDNG